MQPHQQLSVMESRYVLPYNWCSPKHTRFWRGKKGLSTIIAELLGDVSQLTVLDAGCGDGWYTARLVKHASRVIGLDFSERSVGFARLIVPKAEFLVGSITKIPLPDAAVDAVVSIQVIEHLPPSEVSSAIAEFARVLKTDGTCIVSVPSVNRHMSTAHFQHFTEETLRATLSKHFDVTRIVGQEHRTVLLYILEKLIANRIWHLPALGLRFANGPFLRYWNQTTAASGQNLVAVCKKRRQS